MIRTAYVNDMSQYRELGVTVIGKTAYRVYDMPVKEASAAAGVVRRFGLIGPKGSTYLVTDWGSAYGLNSVCLGGGTSWQAAPRPLRGLERKHLAMFYETPETTGAVN